MVNSYGLQSSVQWMGWRSKEELKVHYQTADCFVNPSLIEGMSNAILEAMACGLPVLAGDCSGNRELIADGRNGFLFAPDDPVNLSEKIRVLSGDMPLCRKLGSSGRERCSALFSWTSVTAQINKVIGGHTRQ
jgi:glycosyltransferase involved in cell wall biosynthesis